MGGREGGAEGETARGREVSALGGVRLRLRCMADGNRCRSTPQVPHARLLAVRRQRIAASATGRARRQDDRGALSCHRCGALVLALEVTLTVSRTLQRGLLDEIDELWRIAHAPGAEPVDYSKGIYQAIGARLRQSYPCHSRLTGSSIPARPGYKEFAPYLDLAHRSPSLTLDSSPELRALFNEGVERTKVATRQYAKRQVKWIKGKLLPAVRTARDGAEGEEDVTVVLLDASGTQHCLLLLLLAQADGHHGHTDLSRWGENVRAPAVELLHSASPSRDLPDHGAPR